jgi:hypothetical protein
MLRVAKLNSKTGKRRPKTVRQMAARDSAGRFMEIYTIDPKSPTFRDDLTYVYRTNIASARRENKRLFGSADGFNKTKYRGRLNAARKK